MTQPEAYTPRHLAEEVLKHRSALVGERKRVTVLFADVKGSMELAEHVDPEEWHELLDGFFRILADGVHRYEGTVNQYTGDGIMALFGAPAALEDHAQRACHAALQLRQELRRYGDELKRTRGLVFAVRIGLESGEVVVGRIGDDLRMDYTAQGHTVGLAQRMEQLADPGAIYVGPGTAALVAPYFRLRGLGAFSVPGVGRPVEVSALEGPAAVRSRFDVARAGGLSRFVGREAELASLEAALAEAGGGAGCVLRISGPPGVGKSRLCHEVVVRCRERGVRVAVAQCVAHGLRVPLLPQLDLLRSYFGIDEQDDDDACRDKVAGRILRLGVGAAEDVAFLLEFLGIADPERPAPPADVDVRQRKLAELERRLVEAGSMHRPQVLLFEDLHWIDPASEAALREMERCVTGTRTVLIETYRPEYRPSPLAASDCRELVLGPLAPAPARELIRHLLGKGAAALASPIEERTGGNPFFIEETVRELAESGVLMGARGAYSLARSPAELETPTSVQALLAARIDRLGDAPKLVLQRAAVIGKSMSRALLGDVCAELDVELDGALQVLCDAGFLEERAEAKGAAYAFVHPLTREVAYRSQLRESRRRVHHAVARALEVRSRARLDEAAALIAYHSEEAGDGLGAARWHIRAAEWAGVRDAGEGMRHVRRARELLARLEAPESDDVLRLRLEACLRILAAGWMMGLSVEEEERLTAEGRALAGRLGDAAASERLEFLRSALRAVAGRGLPPRGAGPTAEIEGRGSVLEAGMRLVAELAAGRVARAFAAVDEAFSRLRAGEESPTTAAGMATLSMRTVLPLYLGRVREAEQSLAWTERYAEQHDVEGMRAAAAALRSFLAELVGDEAAASRYGARAVELADRIAVPFVQLAAYTNWAGAHLLGRRWEEAAAACERGLALLRDHQTGANFDVLLRGRLALARLGAGDLAGAREAAEAALAAERQFPMFECFARLCLGRVDLADAGGRALVRAERHLLRAQTMAEEMELGLWLPRILVERGRVAEIRGDDEERRRLLERARSGFAATGARLRAAEVGRWLAGEEAFCGGGRTGRASPGA